MISVSFFLSEKQCAAFTGGEFWSAINRPPFFFFFCTEKKRNFQHPLGGKEMRKSSQYLSSTALYLSKIIFIETTPQGSLCLELNEVL